MCHKFRIPDGCACQFCRLCCLHSCAVNGLCATVLPHMFAATVRVCAAGLPGGALATAQGGMQGGQEAAAAPAAVKSVTDLCCTARHPSTDCEHSSTVVVESPQQDSCCLCRGCSCTMVARPLNLRLYHWYKVVLLHFGGMIHVALTPKVVEQI
jgi:hypothetical protein